MFAAITVVIALLGLLLLGLSFMQGVALGAATAVLATMFAALTIIPALIGGSGNFIDGVLHEFDERGGFRFWGTQAPLHAARARAGASRRAGQPRAQARRGRRLGALVARRPARARGSPRRRAGGPPRAWPCRRPNMRLGSSDAGVDPPGHHDARGLRPDRRGLRRRHQRLVPARRRARPEGRQGGGRSRSPTRCAPTRTSPSSRRRRSRRTAGVATVSAYPRTGTAGGGDDRHAQAPAQRRRARGRAPDRRAGRGRRLHGLQRGLLARGGEQAAALRRGRRAASARCCCSLVFRSVVIPIKAAIMNLLSIGAALGLRDPGLPGGARVEPARDRHRADRVLRPGADVRHRLRAEHGLRGLPDLARPRGVGAQRTTPRRRSRAACRPRAG